MTQEQFFARYRYDRIKDRIGSGGFGNVFKAFDTRESETVALKIAEVKPGLESLSLQKEVELASSLERHVNIARYSACYRFDLPNGLFDFGILQYYPLGNLSQLVKSKKLSEAEKEKIVNGIISGIQHLHSNNVVHRDLKSANILIAEGYQGEYVTKIADFGLSKQFTENEKSYFSNSFAGGSLLYVAPEQLEGKELRKNVDLWSLGVVLYELFVGETPFKASVDDGSETARAEIISKIKNASIPAAISTIPSKWQEVIRGCLVTDPTKRIKSIEDVMSKVGMAGGSTLETDIEDKEPPRPKPKPTPQPKPVPNPTPASVSKWIYYLIGGIALTVAAMMGIRSCGSGADGSTDLVVYEEGDRFGYKDASGTVVIPARYEMVSPFSGGRGKVSVADSVYYIDERGSIAELIKPKPETPTEEPKPDDTTAKDESAWQQAKSSNTKASYERYIRDYASGKYVSEARSKIRDIENNENAEASRKQDESAWQQAKSSNTKPSYERYIRDYANGKYVSEARSKIRDIEAAEQKPQEQVSSSKPYIKMISIPGRNFKLSETEVTIGQYLAFCKATNSHWPEWLEKGSKYNIYTGSNRFYKEYGMSESNIYHAIVGVGYDDAVAFCKWIGGRLPTVDEWKYAAKGGQNYFYAGSNNLDEVAWYRGNSDIKVHKVKQLKANGYGLFDMSGNVQEWTVSKNGVWVPQGCDWATYNGFCGIHYNEEIHSGDPDVQTGFRLSKDN